MKTLLLAVGCMIGLGTPTVINAVNEEETTGVEVVETSEENELISIVNEKADDAKEWIDKFFSADKVAMYMSWVAYIGTIIGLVANLNKLKKQNNLTLKNVSDDVKSVLRATIGSELTAKFEAFLPKMLETQEKTNQIMTIFAKILALSQENTPESRVAILNLIEELGTVSKEVVDNAREIIEDGVKVAEETKKELEERIDSIVETLNEDGYDGTSI